MRQNASTEFARLCVTLAIIVVAWLLMATGCNDDKQADERPALHHMASGTTV